MPTLTALDTAHRMMARERAANDAPADDVVVADRALRHLVDALVGWFGPLGAHALVTRALAQTGADHAALAGVHIGARSTPYLEGLEESGRVHGAAAAADAAVDVLACVVEVLGRLIGDTLATALVEQGGRSGAPARGPRRSPSTDGAADTGNAGGAAGADSDTKGSQRDD